MTRSLVLGMVFGVLLLPTKSKAGFFSSIFNNQASAEVTAPSIDRQVDNSQTMALLQANVPSTQILENKKDIQINPNTEIQIVSETSLLPATSPMGISNNGDTIDSSSSQTSIYVVRKGDSISQIADLFGVSADTILSINNMKKGQNVKEGDILLILPFSGIEHIVLKGQTLKGIANLYKIDINEILSANDIDINTELIVGDKLIIPGAEIPNEPVKPKPKPKTSSTKIGKDLQSSSPSISGYFKNPVPGARRTRGIKTGHMGVDLAAPEGTPIHAAATGAVLIARTGYNGGFGTYAVIQHNNGCKTLYAHMSKIGTSAGARVTQGEVIGYVGNTGRSFGNHLHVETIGCKNPF